MIENLHIELRDCRTPIDNLEPVSVTPTEDLREAALRYVSIMNAFARRIESGFMEGNLRSAQVAFWSTAYALGLGCCEGMTMTERAVHLGVERATISKGARNFIAANDLPPSWYMKQDTDGYVASRLAQLNSGNGSNGNGSHEV